MNAFKRIGCTLVLGSLLIAVSASNKIKGDSNTELGKYVIEESAESMAYKGKELKAYRLCYENCKKDILIGVEEMENCRNYIVLVDDLQIQYVCDKGVFGVKRVPRQKETSLNVKEVVDRQQFFYQKVITQKPKTEKELLGLIACYYPSLLKPGFLLQKS